MRIKFAGGVGEHGRSCFLVESAVCSFLVDCGLMAGAQDPYPRLTKQEIQGLDFILLTHSHADHVGALPWLAGQGFSGTVIASRETLAQLKTPPYQAMTLEESHFPSNFRIRWGRSGHCVGSVWYHLMLDGKCLLFSGDYTECSLAYETDPIRDVAADIAVLDSAYGSEDRTPDQMRQAFLKAAAHHLFNERPLLLPVPKFGRGLELALMLHTEWPALPIYGDAHFQEQIIRGKEDHFWITTALHENLDGLQVQQLPDDLPNSGLCFVSDPQLRTGERTSLARKFDGAVLLTGTVEKHTGSWQLLQEGAARFCRVPVHCTDKERMALEKGNHFSRVIPYHTTSHPCLKREIFL